MNLLVFNDISKDSPEIADFKNILRYSLMFDYKSAITDDLINLPIKESEKVIKESKETIKGSKEIIKGSKEAIKKYEEAIKESEEACKFMEELFEKCFTMLAPLFGKYIPTDFFASPVSATQADSYISLGQDRLFWKSSLKYHCIISTLFTIKHFKLINSTLSLYQLNTLTKANGYFSLKSKKLLDDSETKLKRAKHKGEFEINTETPSNFSKSFKTFFEKLSDTEQKRILHFSERQANSLSNADFTYRLYKNRIKYLNLRKAYIEENKTDSIYDFFSLSDSFFQSFFNNSENACDEILLRYMTERYYNLSMTSELINTIITLANKEDYFHLDSFSSEILSICFDLPNVFSRNTYLKFAFHSYSNENLTNNIFRKRNFSIGGIHELPPPMSSLDRPIVWMDLFKKFNLFFSKLIFPVFEKSFYIMLIESLQRKELVNSEKDLLSLSMRLLEKYIEIHSKDILHCGAVANEELDSLSNSIAIPSSVSSFTSSQEKTISALLQNVLKQQNNIFHPKSYQKFTGDYLGIWPGKRNTYHNALINLYIDSIVTPIPKE